MEESFWLIPGLIPRVDSCHVSSIKKGPRSSVPIDQEDAHATEINVNHLEDLVEKLDLSDSSISCCISGSSLVIRTASNSSVSVSMATIPVRGNLLLKAVTSVLSQTLLPEVISIESDFEHAGAARTKNKALSNVSSEWVAFLDDDDMFLPFHLESLMDAAYASGADVIYPRPLQTEYIPDPEAFGFGRKFRASAQRIGNLIPSTVLARTSFVKYVGGFQEHSSTKLDDYGLFLTLLDAGAKFYHLDKQTWVWRFNSSISTQGFPDKW